MLGCATDLYRDFRSRATRQLLHHPPASHALQGSLGCDGALPGRAISYHTSQTYIFVPPCSTLRVHQVSDVVEAKQSRCLCCHRSVVNRCLYQKHVPTTIQQAILANVLTAMSACGKPGTQRRPHDTLFSA
eukprot:6196588-Pleurochrysis_carterae.AAC.1